MYRIDNSSAATTLPTPTALGPPGYWTGGNPQTGTQATIVEADWLNCLQEEMMNILTKAGVAAAKSDYTTILRALSILFTGAFQITTSSQTIVVPSWATQIGFRLVGGGGGGAHCQSDGTNYRAGGGGGAGGYCEAQRSVTPGASLTATVGAGGGPEATGGNTVLSFASHWTVTAGGGAGSIWGNPNTSIGGSGGVASGGDLNSNGCFGGDGESTQYSATGYGGDGPWGGGARSALGSSGAMNGGGPGAGGGGVYDGAASGVYYSGGSGHGGLIMYRWLP